MTIEVTQSDREMAADCAVAMGLPFTADEIAAGEANNSTLVQTIARARIAGWNAAVDAAANVCDGYATTYRNAQLDAKQRRQHKEARDFESMGMACAFRSGDIRALRIEEANHDHP